MDPTDITDYPSTDPCDNQNAIDILINNKNDSNSENITCQASGQIQLESNVSLSNGTVLNLQAPKHSTS